MKFFKSEDFRSLLTNDNLQTEREVIADIANEKLEKDIKIISIDDVGIYKTVTVTDPGIYEIRFKTRCEHPKDKIKASRLNPYRDDSDLNKYCFRCQCGKSVKPSNFVEE